MAKVPATVLAAWIAAISAVLAASFTGYAAHLSALHVAKFDAGAVRARQFTSFRRSQVDYLTRTAFESSIELFTEFDSANYVAWIKDETMSRQAEQSCRNIERLRHAEAALASMNASPTDKVKILDQLLIDISDDWVVFTSARYDYRLGIKNGQIDDAGAVKDDCGARIRDSLHAAKKRLGPNLGRLRKLIAEIHAATATLESL